MTHKRIAIALILGSLVTAGVAFAVTYYTEQFDAGDNRGYLGDGDWAPGSYKGQCNSGDSVMGISATPVGMRSDLRAHSVLCAPEFSADTNSGMEVTHSLTGADDRADTGTGDWDRGYTKAECGLGEVVTGVAQSGDSLLKMNKIICSWFYAEVESNDNSCRTLVFSHTSDNRLNTSSGDWAYGYSKNECAPGQILKGVSANAGTGEIHAILCCNTFTAPH